MHEFLNNIITKPDGKTLEFKRDSASPTLLMKTVVAFANTAGGRLIIGVGDDREIVGLKAPLDEEERLRSLIADSIAPHLFSNIELITINGTTLLVVEVFVSALRPHWLKAEGHEQGVYIRIGSSNQQANRALIAELGRSAEGISFDEMPMAELSKDDLDLVAVQKFFASDWRLDEQTLVTVKLLTSYQRRLVPTRGAILLFGKERALHFSDCWVQCGRFTGTDKALLFDQSDIRDHLPQAVESIMQFFRKHSQHEGAIPLTILREAAINALMHADYSQRGAPLRIAFFDDRIEIENPGTLQAGMTLESMKQGLSRIRNHVIARVFRELKITERWGSGLSFIFSEAEALGLPKPQIMEIGIRIRLTIYLAATTTVFAFEAQERVVRQKQAQEKFKADWAAQVGKSEKAQEDVGDEAQAINQSEGRKKAQVRGDVDIHILAACFAAPLSSAEIAHALGHKQLSGNIRKALPRMRDSGLLVYTVPDSHNSRMQKYQLTEEGMALHLTYTSDSKNKKVQVPVQVEIVEMVDKAQDIIVSEAQGELLFGAQESHFSVAQVHLQILSTCATSPLSSAEIANALGHKQLSGNLRKAIPELRIAGLLHYTIPEKPNSRLQRYRLTEKGRTLLSESDDAVVT